MIRLKLFIGLFSAVVVLAVAGALAMGILKFRIDEFDQAFREEYAAIRTLNEVRTNIQRLNAHYIPLFAEKSDYTEIGLDTLAEKQGEISVLLKKLQSGPPIEDLSQDELEALLGEIGNYGTEIKTIIRKNNPANILEIRRDVLDRSLAVFNISDTILESLEQGLSNQYEFLRQSSSDTRISLIIITGVSLLLAIIAYRYLTRGILGPVTHLTESIREIQKRNLDLSIPVNSRDEIGDLNDAFNVMAAELRVLSLEHDENIKRIDAENQAIIGNFPHPIVFLDTAGKVTKINPKAKKLFSYLELVEGLPRRVRTLVNRSIEAGEDYFPEELFNSILLRVDEREFFYLPRIFEIHEKHGFEGWALVLTDVTKLRWIDDIKNNFLATVSHEIRTPLTSVRMILHLLAEQKVGGLDGRQMEMVVSARNETDRLVETITQLLSTSRIEAGDEYLETEKVTPSKLVESSLKNQNFDVRGDKVDIEVECGEDLPPVNVDINGLKLVFQNYLSNAIRHSPKGSPIKVAVRKLSDEFLRFSVIDAGEGVPAELEDSVFEKFVKGANNTRGGVGLGLSISREIIHAHGGRVGLGREDDCTEFYFDLPVS